jgi:hypothetical protein
MALIPIANKKKKIYYFLLQMRFYRLAGNLPASIFNVVQASRLFCIPWERRSPDRLYVCKSNPPIVRIQ